MDLLQLDRRGSWTFALYFKDFHATSSSPRYALHHPFFVLKFYLFALGDVVGVPVKLDQPGGDLAVMAFGAVIFLLAVFVVLKWGIRRDERSGVPVGIAMIVSGLLFDAFVTEGRLFFGL